MTVLICDDDEQMRRLVAIVVRRQGYALREAADGKATLSELARKPPALVILDLHMPGADGLEVLSYVRSDPTLAKTQVLLLSGGKEALDDDWAARVGADAHLPKPFLIGDLEASIQSLLARDR